MSTILGIAGSLRKGSFNAALLRTAAQLTPEGCRIEIASIAGIPLYDGDVEEAGGLPEAVKTLKQQIAAADGLLLVTPEYNGSFPGVMKNALDWASRPGDDGSRVFKDKPVGVIGATPGGLGTVFAQTAWLPVLRSVSMRPFFGTNVYLSGISKLAQADGVITDEPTRKKLTEYLAGFAAFL